MDVSVPVQHIPKGYQGWVVIDSQGSTVNATEIAREVGIDRKVVENYFSILSDLLLSYSIPPFSKHAKRKLVKKEKFYYFDAGVYQQLRPKGILDNSRYTT